VVRRASSSADLAAYGAERLGRRVRVADLLGGSQGGVGDGRPRLLMEVAPHCLQPGPFAMVHPQ
jgi:hypothetical protein